MSFVLQKGRSSVQAELKRNVKLLKTFKHDFLSYLTFQLGALPSRCKGKPGTIFIMLVLCLEGLYSHSCLVVMMIFILWLNMWTHFLK